MKELDQVLSIAAADYRVHIKAIAQLNATVYGLNQQIADLQKVNDSLKSQNEALLKNINAPVPADTPIEGAPDSPTEPDSTGKDDAK